MAGGYNNPGKTKAAKAISGFFKKKEEDEDTAPAVEEDDEEDTLAKRIARGIKSRTGY